MKAPLLRDNYHDGLKHRDKIERKYSRIQGLVALLATYEDMPEPDIDHIRLLKRKLANTRNQLRAMSGAIDEC
jgi:hypothetical protein